MNEKISSVQVRVLEDDPKGITILIRNNPDKKWLQRNSAIRGTIRAECLECRLTSG